jgi:MFS family permease
VLTRWPAVRAVAVARALSLLGSELTVFALILREKEQGASTVALIFALGTIPLIFMAPWAGLIADRFSTRVIIPAASIIQAALVITLVLDSPIWVILMTVFLANSFGSVVPPTWAALLPTIAAKEDLPRAMGLSQSLFALAGLLAPALGGFLVATTGFVWPFVIDSVTFLLIATVPFIFKVNRVGHPSTGSATSGAFDGLRFLMQEPLLRSIVILLTVFIVALGVISVGEVFLITEILGGTAFIYGMAGTLFAAGMLSGGALATARRVSAERFATMVVLSLAVMGTMALGISISWHWSMVLVFGFFMGVGNALLQTYASTIFMTRAPEEIRGRVMAGVGGVINIGSVTALGIGGLAMSVLDVRLTLIIGSASSLVILMIFAPAVLRAGREELSGDRQPA